MKCDDCGEEFDDNVCTVCGLVSEDLIFSRRIPRNFRNNIRTEEKSFISVLSPDLEYMALPPKGAKNKETNRALKRQRKKHVKKWHDYYFRAMKSIESICAQLRLGKNILRESLHICKTIVVDEKTFFGQQKTGNERCLAAVKISCELNNRWLNEKELISVARDYDNGNINLRNNPIRRGINKAAMVIRKKIGIHLDIPDRPQFISVVCREFGFSLEDEAKTYEYFLQIKPRLDRTYKLEGYILGLVYLVFNSKYNITITKMEKAFNIARDTIRNRKQEILWMVQGE